MLQIQFAGDAFCSRRFLQDLSVFGHDIRPGEHQIRAGFIRSGTAVQITAVGPGTLPGHQIPAVAAFGNDFVGGGAVHENIGSRLGMGAGRGTATHRSSQISMPMQAPVVRSSKRWIRRPGCHSHSQRLSLFPGPGPGRTILAHSTRCNPADGVLHRTPECVRQKGKPLH